jgi:hypothetical protein
MNVELSPIAELPEGYLVRVVAAKTNLGALHTPVTREILELLEIRDIDDLSIVSHEQHRLFAVWGPYSYPNDACYLIPTVGTYAVVLMDSDGRFSHHELKPTAGLIIPAGVWFTIQTLNRNRVSFMTVRWASAIATSDDNGGVARKFFPHWENASSDDHVREYMA